MSSPSYKFPKFSVVFLLLCMALVCLRRTITKVIKVVWFNHIDNTGKKKIDAPSCCEETLDSSAPE